MPKRGSLRPGWALWTVQGVLVLTIALLLVLPIQDHGLAQFKEWQDHPSADALRAFQDKKRQEWQIKLSLVVPLVIVVLLLGKRLNNLR